jgi:hypothetical protein
VAVAGRYFSPPPHSLQQYLAQPQPFYIPAPLGTAQVPGYAQQQQQQQMMWGDPPRMFAIQPSGQIIITYSTIPQAVSGQQQQDMPGRHPPQLPGRGLQGSMHYEQAPYLPQP